MLGICNLSLAAAASSFPIAAMPLRFLNPNFHVILIHYPLGVFVTGVLIELLGFMWKQSSVRTAARWMILIGGLSAIPAATSGIFALSDVAHHQKPITGIRYHQLYWHVILQSAATLVAVAIASFGLAASDRWRRKAYLPLLLGLLVVWGVFVAGAWQGGETVYAEGTAVRKLPSKTSDSDAKPLAPVPLRGKKAIDFYLGGLLQIHMIVAGVAFALAIGAMALSVRKISSTYPDPGEVTEDRPLERDGIDPTRDDVAMMRSFSAEVPPPSVIERVYPAGRFWLVAALVTLATAGVGYCMWAMEGSWSLTAFYNDTMTESGKFVMSRMAVHVWIGIAILLLCLILAGVARWATQRALALSIFAVLIVLAIAAQVWIGLLLTFDSAGDSLFRFSPPSAAQPHEDSGSNSQSPVAKVAIAIET